LTEESTKYSENEIEDYNEGRKQELEFWKGSNGQQGGDPAKLALALLKIIDQPNPPKRFWLVPMRLLLLNKLLVP
jgi:hypothetical protein